MPSFGVPHSAPSRLGVAPSNARKAGTVPSLFYGGKKTMSVAKPAKKSAKIDAMVDRVQAKFERAI